MMKQNVLSTILGKTKSGGSVIRKEYRSNYLPCFGRVFLFFRMDFEEASDMYAMWKISPELVCSCDEFHLCQACAEREKEEKKLDNPYDQA